MGRVVSSFACLVALALLAGCGDEGGAPSDAAPAAPAVSAWTPRPGDSLLREAERLVVRALPRSNVPEGLRGQAVARLDGTLERRVDAADWRPRRDVGAADAAAWGLGPGARLWVARAPLRPAGSVPWLLHAGRLLAPSTEKGGRREDLSQVSEWVDADGATRFWWVDEVRELRAARVGPPGEVLVVAQALPGQPRGLEARLLGAARAEHGDELLERVTLGGVDRPCLLAPAPSALGVRVDLAHVDELAVELGLFDPGLTLGDTTLASDGVIFRVELDDGSGSRELARRVLREAGAWKTWRVPLPPSSGAVTLRLRVDEGPFGDASADYALWSDLRLLGEPTRAPDAPHVVLIDVDTLRADRLGLYGYERDTSPRLDAWAAAHALVFERALSTNSWTLPATASMLTGLTVAEHGAWGFPGRLEPEHESVAVLFARAGYETRAETEGGFVIPTFGFAHGFDVFDVSVDHVRVPKRDAWLALRRDLAERRSERPLFCFLQTYEVHDPYLVDDRFRDPSRPPFEERADSTIERDPGLRFVRVPREGASADDLADVHDWYDAAVRRMDARVGALLAALPGLFGEQPYVVLITSDHGEELGERGQVGHAHGLHGELLHVPLLLSAPGLAPGRVDTPVSLIDVAPTLLAAAGLEVPERLGGRSLLEAPRERPLVAALRPGVEALVADGFKLMTHAPDAGGQARLYDLSADPRELHDLADARPDDVARLVELLQARRGVGLLEASEAGGLGLDPDTVANLRALGYLGEDP